MAYKEKANSDKTGAASPGNTFFNPSLKTIQRQQKDLPGTDPEPPRNFFVTPDSRGITNNTGNKISLDIHIDFLPSHTHLHVYTASQKGGDYRQGAPSAIIGEPGKGGDYAVTLSPVPDNFFIVFKAISDKTGINVPGITGTCVINLD